MEGGCTEVMVHKAVHGGDGALGKWCTGGGYFTPAMADKFH